MNKDQLKVRIDKIKCKFKEVTGKILNEEGMKSGGMTLKKKYLAGLAIGFYLTAWTGTAGASFSIAHSGSTDPATEGFSVWPYNYGSSTVGPVQNDIGYDAWSVKGLTQNTNYEYYSGPLSINQQSDIANQGFVLTTVDRVLQGVAPAYTPGIPAIIGQVGVYTGSQVFEVDLGVSSNGNTVVMLPDILDLSGSILVTPGASYTLTGSGNSYHTYQLAYNPATQLADLFVDGIERIQNYAGVTYNPATEGNSRGMYSLIWGGINGGQANFNSVQLTSSPVPIPGSFWLLGSGIAGLAGISKRRKKI